MRILIIEDERKVLEFVKRGLQAERFAVDEAQDAKTGLQLASHYEYDLVILDLMLGSESGTDVLTEIRHKNKSVPILILTARDAVADKVRNLEAGADDYLTKPFSFAELQARVMALIRRGAVNRTSILTIADLEMDRLAHQVKRADRKVDLTGKEYSLLEYLMTNQGRVLSRTMIIEHVWDQSFEGLTNIVDVYIRQLRAKIDAPHDLKMIKTVRGVGYSISDEREE